MTRFDSKYVHTSFALTKIWTCHINAFTIKPIIVTHIDTWQARSGRAEFVKIKYRSVVPLVFASQWVFLQANPAIQVGVRQ